MSIRVDKNLCTGCTGKSEPPCVKNCPGDLIFINPESGKAELRNQYECWDCMVCVKSCPCQALESRLPFQLATYKASLKVKMGEENITWKLKDIYGQEEIFTLSTKNA